MEAVATASETLPCGSRPSRCYPLSTGRGPGSLDSRRGLAGVFDAPCKRERTRPAASSRISDTRVLRAPEVAMCGRAVVVAEESADRPVHARMSRRAGRALSKYVAVRTIERSAISLGTGDGADDQSRHRRFNAPERSSRPAGAPVVLSPTAHRDGARSTRAVLAHTLSTGSCALVPAFAQLAAEPDAVPGVARRTFTIPGRAHRAPHTPVPTRVCSHSPMMVPHRMSHAQRPEPA